MKTLKLDTPHIIVMVGIPGAGKSYFANKFATFFSLPVLSTEKLKMFGSERAMLYFLQEMLKSRSSFIYDGDSSSKKLRDALSRIAKKAGYDILFVWIQIDLITARQRYEEKSRLQDFSKLEKDFNPPVQNGNVLVLSGKHAYATQMRMVLGRLVSKRPNTSLAGSSKPERKITSSRR